MISCLISRLLNQPISRKLQQIVLVASGLAFLLVGSLMVLVHGRDYSRDLQKQTAIALAMVGRNCSASLLFADPRTAQEVLRSLQRDPRILRATLFAADGTLFASYQADPGAGAAEQASIEEISLPPVRRTEVRDGEIHHWEPILLDGELVGQLYGVANLAERSAFFRRQMLILGAVTVLCLALVALLIQKLQTLVTAPILALAAAASEVRRRHDYTLRVEKLAADESGTLVDAFNAMLGEIEETTVARELAEEASRAKSEFLATMSHEIRTPMNGVLSMTDILLNTELADEQHDYLRTIRTSAEALMVIINDILDFSRIEAKKITLLSAPFDLRAMLEDLLHLLRAQACRKHLWLALHFDPESVRGLEGDAGRIRQILANIIGNAVKFTDHGGVSVTVRARPLADAPQRAHLEIAIRDTGDGIPEVQLERLFMRFSQADSSATRKHGGTGLGLAISKELARLMQGDVVAESVVGEGSTFRLLLELPLAAAQPRPPSLPAAVTAARVLVAEENPQIRREWLLDLKALGLAAELAPAGAAASALAQIARECVPPCDYLLTLPPGEGATNGRRLLQALAGPAPTAVEVLLPLKERHLARSLCRAAGVPYRQGAVPQSHAAANPAELCGIRILLAEDNPVNQKVATIILRKLGCVMHVVNNGEEALAEVQRERYDLVLMDCQMPQMDGYQATRMIRLLPNAEAEIPIIAMTANAMEGDRERCLQSGMDDYLTKPIQPSALIAALQRWTGVPPSAPAPGVESESGVESDAHLVDA
jgi:signal transduction histidine kinase/CheY-like chemotaxis protein